ncbi:ATP-binding protein [Geobacter pickeringii]|uniref:histidine kinase n=1 Tax=Geobacter pickeringii TaxID=345632 RepID=A0A0B5BKC1_9BACT|nr:ATP-binding protein [Geobacter pickeringii]AJE04506.1 histidine kinase [Geobacter pickeringii]
MAVQDHFRIVSSAIRIANITDRPHHERLKALAHLVAEAFHCVSVTFFVSDGESRQLSRQISTQLPDGPFPCSIPFGKGIAGRCAANSKQLRRGVSALHPGEPFVGNERQIAAYPLTDGNRLVGVASLGSVRDERLSGDEEELLQIVLLEAAGVVRCMKQLEETNRRIQELSFLNQISNAMLSTVRLNRLIRLILSSLTSGPTPLFDRAMLFLANERSRVLQGMMGMTCEDGAASPLDEESPSGTEFPESEFDSLVKATRLPLDETRNLVSRAVAERTVILTERPSREQPVDRTFLRRFGSAPCAIAPLIAQERVIGAIFVDNQPSGRPIPADEVNLLQLFTNQAGMAIENSILFNRLEDTNRNLHEAQERLLQGEKLADIGKMAAIITHELKTPLVSVGGFAGRLKKRVATGSEEWQYADLIQREVLHLEKLLADILFFSKKTTICYSRCTINQIVEDALGVVTMPLEEKRIQVEKRLTSRLSSFLGDCQQLRHVFINLLSNANEVMDPGGTLTIESFPTTLNGNRAVAVKVSDTGCGIPVDVIHTIFDPFFTTKETGTGLGLAISHRIITNHGGRIDVANRPEGGAEFTVVLPVKP